MSYVSRCWVICCCCSSWKYKLPFTCSTKAPCTFHWLNSTLTVELFLRVAEGLFTHPVQPSTDARTCHDESDLAVQKNPSLWQQLRRRKRWWMILWEQHILVCVLATLLNKFIWKSHCLGNLPFSLLAHADQALTVSLMLLNWFRWSCFHLANTRFHRDGAVGLMSQPQTCVCVWQLNWNQATTSIAS